jgi:thiosulfate reductase cytochrome b subunit
VDCFLSLYIFTAPCIRGISVPPYQRVLVIVFFAAMVVKIQFIVIHVVVLFLDGTGCSMQEIPGNSSSAWLAFPVATEIQNAARSQLAPQGH